MEPEPTNPNPNPNPKPRPAAAASMATTPSPPPSGGAAAIQEKWINEPGRICLLSFDKPGSSANTLDPSTLLELERLLTEIEAARDIRGVIFISAKESVFLAGADLELLKKGPENPALLSDYLELGQQVFNRIAALQVPTVAAIHGACLGGGYELALACDFRLATPDKQTRIGLPETKLGILPAWGGSTRLPRLVGIPRALDLVLRGRTLDAEAALRLGMIDQVVPRQWLLGAALRKIGKRAKARPSAWRGWINRITATTVGGRARAGALRRTHGHYPAAIAALDVILAGAGTGDPAPSLAREREAVTRLAGDPECRNLFRVFLLQEAARKAAREAAKGTGGIIPTRQAAVIGAGVMGAAIAQWLSARGIGVLLREVDAERLGAGMERIRKLYDEAVARHLMTRREARDGMDRISPAAYEAPLARAQWVIEAAVEKFAVKEALFRNLDAAAPPETLLATNTSALPVGRLAAGTGRPGHVLGLHFFNPVHRMPLVEVVLPERAGPDLRQRALAFVHQIGKTPVVVRDTPGFLVNRVLLPYLMQAAAAFDNGASVEAVDSVMVEFGMPMGPLRLADEVGLDVALEVARTLAEAYPARIAVPPFLVTMVEAGLLGRKTGHGFYQYAGGREPRANWNALSFRKGGTAPDLESLRNRMVFRMLDEAARCVEEKVVATPGEADLGMVLGAGFPPFRGGPLRYIDTLGAGTLVAEMEALRLEPCGRLREMAAQKRKFYEDAAE